MTDDSDMPRAFAPKDQTTDNRIANLERANRMLVEQLNAERETASRTQGHAVRERDELKARITALLDQIDNLEEDHTRRIYEARLTNQGRESALFEALWRMPRAN